MRPLHALHRFEGRAKIQALILVLDLYYIVFHLDVMHCNVSPALPYIVIVTSGEILLRDCMQRTLNRLRNANTF